MRIAERLASAGFAALAAFQLGLASGAPLGHAAWGGTSAHLTTAQRVGSAASVLFYLAAIQIVRACGDGRTERRFRWGTWILAALLAVAAVANIASGSHWENYLLAPVAVLLAALCVILARGRTEISARSSPRRAVVAKE